MTWSRLLLCGCLVTVGTAEVYATAPQSPRIGNVEILADQGWAENPTTIWYDDFESTQPLGRRYLEYVTNKNEFSPVSYESLGGSGKAMRARWQAGEVEAGNLKKTFGRNPMDYKGFAARPTEDFSEIFWRQYVKMQDGWMGQPAKLNRATAFSSSDWSQAMIAHIWNGSPTGLATDPVRGVNSASEVVTTGYNDFNNFTWLGSNGASSRNAQIFDTSESGRWVSVEGHVKLNTPGQADGVLELFIDGQREVSRTNMNWVYAWDDYGINAVYLENWWNSGSPVEQERYIDDFVISTSYIGLARSPWNPLVTKTVFHDPDPGDRQAAWQLQIATDLEGNDVVWDSDAIPGEGLQVVVNGTNGTFQGSLSGTEKLLEDHLYALRVRQQDNQGQWSSWSNWNTSLQTGSAVTLTGDFDSDIDVDGADFLRWQRGSGSSYMSEDLAAWQANFGTSVLVNVAENIPEPTTGVLTGISAWVATLMWQRQFGRTSIRK